MQELLEVHLFPDPSIRLFYKVLVTLTLATVTWYTVDIVPAFLWQK